MTQPKRARYALIIDPDEAIGLIIAAVLIEEGLCALCASDDAQARTTIQNLPPQVVLLDLHLQHWARALIELIRSTSAHHVPIIGMDTADCPPETFAEWGLSGYIAKPFNIDELLEYIKPYLVGASDAAGQASAAHT